MNIEILETSDFYGCELRKERVSTGPPDKDIIWEMVYAPDGGLVGTIQEAHRIIVKLGILPEKRLSHSNSTSIGFSEKSQKWYGWSHRASHAFTIRDFYFKNFEASIGRRIQNLEEARESAANYAESVS